jgi:hypothetical protein
MLPENPSSNTPTMIRTATLVKNTADKNKPRRDNFLGQREAFETKDRVEEACQEARDYVDHVRLGDILLRVWVSRHMSRKEGKQSYLICRIAKKEIAPVIKVPLYIQDLGPSISQDLERLQTQLQRFG